MYYGSKIKIEQYERIRENGGRDRGCGMFRRIVRQRQGFGQHRFRTPGGLSGPSSERDGGLLDRQHQGVDTLHHDETFGLGQHYARCCGANGHRSFALGRGYGCGDVRFGRSLR